jgi:beta-glucanase (GH16 family)
MKAWKWIQHHYVKVVSGLLVAFLIGFWLYLQSQRIDLKGYTLSYEETFDGSALSEDWTTVGDGSFRYIGFYDDDQVKVEDGKLVIGLTYKLGDKGIQLYGSEVQSTFGINQGYVEVRAKLPKSNVINAVISLSTEAALSTTDPTQGAKIVFASTQHAPYPLIATGIYYSMNAPETENAVAMSLVYGEFHTYGLLWTEESYAFYFDGIKLWESVKTPTSTVEETLSFAFEFPYYTQQDIKTLDITLEIDSVRIYTKP